MRPGDDLQSPVKFRFQPALGSLKLLLFSKMFLPGYQVNPTYQPVKMAFQYLYSSNHWTLSTARYIRTVLLKCPNLASHTIRIATNCAYAAWANFSNAV